MVSACLNLRMAPRAIKAGGPSPTGDPFAILPPIVAEFLIWTAPYLKSMSVKLGNVERKLTINSAMVHAAPICIVSVVISMCFNCSHPPKKIIFLKLFNFFVMSKLKSVAPATNVASGLFLYNVARSSSD